MYVHLLVRSNIPSNAVSMTILLCTYQESTSDASDTSSITAVSGSPPESRKAHSDEDDKRILSWAEDVANSDSDDSHAVCPLTFRIEVIVDYPFRGLLQVRAISSLSYYHHQNWPRPSQLGGFTIQIGSKSSKLPGRAS